MYFRDIREQILLSCVTNDLDEIEFALLYDPHRSSNPDIHYWKYEHNIHFFCPFHFLPKNQYNQNKYEMFCITHHLVCKLETKKIISERIKNKTR